MILIMTGFRLKIQYLNQMYKKKKADDKVFIDKKFVLFNTDVATNYPPFIRCPNTGEVEPGFDTILAW